jgi:hypothetical protein
LEQQGARHAAAGAWHETGRSNTCFASFQSSACCRGKAACLAGGGGAMLVEMTFAIGSAAPFGSRCASLRASRISARCETAGRSEEVLGQPVARLGAKIGRRRERGRRSKTDQVRRPSTRGFVSLLTAMAVAPLLRGCSNSLRRLYRRRHADYRYRALIEIDGIVPGGAILDSRHASVGLKSRDWKRYASDN